MNRKILISSSILSGALLGVSWLPALPGVIGFIALIPLLYLEHQIFLNKQQSKTIIVFLYAYLSFAIWNLIAFWWVNKASWFGVVAPVVLNSLFMAIVFWLFHITRRIIGNSAGYISLVIYWLAFEYIHTFWELQFPWLNLGNLFAKHIKLIQWYEYTGALGGTLWLLVINILAFNLIQIAVQIKQQKSLIIQSIIFLLVLVAPMIFSIAIFNSYTEKNDSRNITILQPNTDPYHQRYDAQKSHLVLLDLLHLAQTSGDSSTDYFVAPETALTQGLWLDGINQDKSTSTIRQFIGSYSHASFILGLTTLKQYQPNEPKSYSARYVKERDMYYDIYNSAMLVDTSNTVQLYHKSRLVMGVEKIPFHRQMGFLNSIAEKMGGIVGSLGTQTEPSLFTAAGDSVATIICWESVFGEYVSQFVQKGAGLLFIVTNDGWWGDTPGYKTHVLYSRLRAIENRRSIARAANTGISCFINQRGETIQPTKYWVKTAQKASLNYNRKYTWYTINGDYIGRICLFISTLLLLSVLVSHILQKAKA